MMNLPRSRSTFCQTCRGVNRVLAAAKSPVQQVFERDYCTSLHDRESLSRLTWKRSELWYRDHHGSRKSFLGTPRQFGTQSSDNAAGKNVPTSEENLQAQLEREAKLQHRIVEICDDTAIPYGEFTVELWDESLQILNEITSHTTALGLECSCMLMERLIIEQDSRTSTLQIMVSSNDKAHQFSSLTTEHLNRVTQNWQICSTLQRTNVTPSQILSLMDDWVYRLNNDLNPLHPDVDTYFSLLKGSLELKNSNTNPPGAVKAFVENLFQRMMRESDDNQHPNVRPNTATFDAIIHALTTKFGDIPRAEFYLEQMFLEVARRGNAVVGPNLTIFQYLLQAYSNIAQGPNYNNAVPERAHTLLRHMQHLHNLKTLINVKPDATAYTHVLTCWAKSTHPQAPGRVQELYQEMKAQQICTVHALTSVLLALAKAGEAGTAQAILDEHLQYHVPATSSLDDVKDDSNKKWQRHPMLPKPSKTCFEHVLSGWSTSNDPRAVTRMDDLIRRMKDLSSSGVFPGATMTTQGYNHFLTCMEKSSGVMEKQDIIMRTEETVKEMEELAATGDSAVKPNAATYTRLILVHATHGQDPYKAEAVLERMYQYHLEDGKSKSTQPNTRSFNVCLKAWAEYKVDTCIASERSIGILRRMWNLHETGVLADVRPNTISYSTVMMCLLRSKLPERGERCQDLLEQAEAKSIPLTEICYVAPVLTWDDAEKAENSLNHFIDQHRLGKINFRPDNRLFDTVIEAWSRSGKPTAAARVTSLIDQMQERYGSGLLKDPPSRKSYNGLLQSWVGSGDPWAGENAAKILQMMISEADNAGKTSLAPITEDYNCVLQAFAREGRGSKAEALLNDMMDVYLGPSSRERNVFPSVSSFNAVLAAWSNAKDVNASGRVEGILEQMSKLHEAGTLGVKPNAESLEIVLNCLTKEGQRVSPRRAESLLERYASIASRSSWHTVMHASATLGNADQAERLMRSMYKEFEDSGSIKFQPSAGTYNIVLKAISNSENENKGERAEALLREMQQNKGTKPNKSTFLKVMSCYKKSNHPAAIERVESLWGEVKKLANDGDIEYDTVIFHEMMSAYAWHGAPQKAQDMLDELCETVLDKAADSRSNNSNLEVNSRSMNTVLSAWTRAKNPERAEAILRRMRDYHEGGVSGMAPIAMNYVRVIECWNQSDHPSAGERADELLKLMEKDAKKRGRSHLFHANRGFYLSVMKRLAQSGSAERAEDLLRRIQNLFAEEKADTAIDQFLYREVLLAWTQSEATDASERIKMLEEEFRQRFPNARVKL